MFGNKIHDLFTKDIPGKLKGISIAYTEYSKAITYEKLVIIISGISIIAILFIAVNLFLLFLAIGLALYIGKLLGSFSLGFVILGTAYLLVGALIYIMRKRWIINPVVKVLQTILYSEEGVFDSIVKVEEEVADEQN